MGIIDIIVFIVFVVSVITIGLVKSRGEHSGEDFFLAGRGLTWPLIGFSLIAANISTEQFVGMSGNAASHVGLAIASYEWMAAVTLVVVGFCFLPYFLRAGIFTMPEFLEYRYNGTARTIMAVATIFIYMLLLGAVTYSGALTLSALADKQGYNLSLSMAAVIIGVIAMIYVAAGGLKACAWADLIQGSALVIGGAIIMFFAFGKLGGAETAAMVSDVKEGTVEIRNLSADEGSISRFWGLNKERMNMFLPASDSILPWTALLLGLWIPNFYYWGLNQYITQRTLGSSSLEQGQKGIVFAAFLKLLIPFVVVIPGIIAFNLYHDDMRAAAAPDNGPVLAKYLKANPTSALVSVQQAPTQEQIDAWPEGKYMIAVYPDAEAAGKAKAKGGYVFPISQTAFSSAQKAVPDKVTFTSDDYTWDNVNAGLAAEIAAFNETVGDGAAVEKLLGYKYDTALAQLLGNTLPQKVGLVGFVLAALLGAVVSSLAAMLNAASTIFTMDLYKKFIKPDAEPRRILRLGRVMVVVFTAVAVFLAPALGNPKISNSIFTIIQEGQGFISPGILAVFVFGLISRKAPPIAGVAGLLTNIAAYGILKVSVPQIQFLNRMAICFGLCLAVMLVIRLVKPLPERIEFKKNTTIELHSSKPARTWGIVVVVLTLLLYFLFSPAGLVK